MRLGTRLPAMPYPMNKGQGKRFWTTALNIDWPSQILEKLASLLAPVRNISDLDTEKDQINRYRSLITFGIRIAVSNHWRAMMLKKLRCFAGDEDETLEHLVTLLLEQAENGWPFANVVGRRINLTIQQREDDQVVDLEVQ